MRDSSPDESRAWARLVTIVRKLRVKRPWDHEQTLASLSKHLIEEAYEAADAIERGALPESMDEIGVLAAQTIFVSAIAAEEQRFTLATMIDAAAEKLTRRHPHVFGDHPADTADAVVANWNRIKATEPQRAGATSAPDHIPRPLPALIR